MCVCAALRGQGSVLTCVTRRMVQSLRRQDAPNTAFRPACAWARLESLLALGYVRRVGATRSLMDSFRGCRMGVGLFHFHQRVDGYAILRAAPRPPGLPTAVRAQGPPLHADVAASGPEPTDPALQACPAFEGVEFPVLPVESGVSPGCLVYLGPDPDATVL